MTHILIVEARFYDAIADAALEGALAALKAAGATHEILTVPGALEVPGAVALAAGAVARITVIKEDASLAAFYLISLALGVTLVSIRGSAVDLLHVLFGNVLALDDDVLLLLSGVATVTLVTLALIYRPLVLDGNAARGISPPKSNWARRIEKPPFRAFPIISTNCFTFGGLKVNTDAQVLDQDSKVIPGLYAAGETVGIYNNVYVGSTSVLRGAVFGRLAGLHAAMSFQARG